MVAWTNAPRAAALAMLQPESAGDAPFGPVSWYGVARPCALSGSAGTTMSQSVLSAAATAGADAAAEPDADGQGAGEAAADAGALAFAAGALAAAAGALAAAEAHEPRADCSTVVVLCTETPRMIPRVRPKPCGVARGPAVRGAGQVRRPRQAA